MLAKFENGYYLEIFEEIDKEDVNESIYSYCVYDEDLDYVNNGWTKYRDIELYYPMNLIDYILEYCEPNDVTGKYEILEYKTMEAFLMSLKEDYNGKWVLERQGTDFDDISYYKSEKAARFNMMKEIRDYEDYENQDINDTYCEITDEEFYQNWTIYKRKRFKNRKDELFYEIEKEIERTYNGISQYACELQDTSVASSHLDKIMELIIELKEVI